jgi:hypothetical protein
MPGQDAGAHAEVPLFVLARTDRVDRTDDMCADSRSWDATSARLSHLERLIPALSLQMPEVPSFVLKMGPSTSASPLELSLERTRRRL